MKNKNNQKGFTLLEALVAIFILTLSITGPVYIASIAFRNTIDSRDNIAAQYIAEEVIEVLKNKRDTLALSNAVAEVDWISPILEGVDCLNDNGVSSDKCVMTKNVEEKKYIFTQCSLDTCPNIQFSPDGKDVVYGDSTATNVSKFIREFYIEKETEEGADLTGVKVVVNIKWNDKGRERVYTLTERLYNTNYSQYFRD